MHHPQRKEHNHIDDEVMLGDLATEVRWVAWREELKPGTEKPTKIPYCPRTGSKARTDDPSTFGDRKQAERRWRKLDDGSRGGVGIVLGNLAGDVLMGIDLDSCIDEKGFISDWATEVVERFDTYAEVSPSGRGVKLFFLVAAEDTVTIDTLLGGKTRKFFAAGEHLRSPSTAPATTP